MILIFFHQWRFNKSCVLYSRFKHLWCKNLHFVTQQYSWNYVKNRPWRDLIYVSNFGKSLCFWKTSFGKSLYLWCNIFTPDLTYPSYGSYSIVFFYFCTFLFLCFKPAQAMLLNFVKKFCISRSLGGPFLSNNFSTLFF